MGLRLWQVDVFAERPLEGNPLAVFLAERALTDSAMQALAREMNLSETAFVTRVDPDGSGYDVRIFTPRSELPFAGHPSVGTAFVLWRLGRLRGDGPFTQRSRVGRRAVRRDADGRFWVAAVYRGHVGAESPERVARALGLAPRDLDPGIPPVVADAGLRQRLVALATDALPNLRPRAERLAALDRAAGTSGTLVYRLADGGRVLARFFAPLDGIAEDPGTGSAAAALGGFLAERLGLSGLEVSQGVAMGRPSTLLVRVDGARVEVGGRVVPVFAGELAFQP